MLGFNFMKTGILKRFREFRNITNIFEKEKHRIKFKSLLKIVSKYSAAKIIKYKEEQISKNI